MATVPSLPELLQRHNHQRQPWYRQRIILSSLGLHVVLAVIVVAAPYLTRSQPEMPDFVSIQIVPAAALGQIAPPPKPKTETPPSTTPTPVKKAPQEAAPTPVAVERSRKTESTPKPAAVQAPAVPVQSLPDNDQAVEDGTGDPGRRLGSPTGNPLATGSSAEISGFDDPDFTYGYYADQMLSRIRAQWERPPIGGEVEMVLHFRIRQDGSVAEVKILRSSGYNSFDRSGLQAVQRATLPPLPKGYRGSSLGVRLIVR